VDVAPLPALRNGYVTFACFNTLSKMNDAVVALWARVLHAVPGSRLQLVAPPDQQVHMQRVIAERYAAHGITADRLLVLGAGPRAAYLATYQQVDIALDPFPYTGGTTTAEALWMGVPVLTLAGKSFLSRQGVGLMMNAGMPEWIAENADDYVKRAVSHAGDLPRLAALRAGMRKRVLASPVFDAVRFAVHFEAALRRVWQEWGETRSGSQA
jgi:predicted O-linked N-acetylglucosamine transferase (SPINDLY family)